MEPQPPVEAPLRHHLTLRAPDSMGKESETLIPAKTAGVSSTSRPTCQDRIPGNPGVKLSDEGSPCQRPVGAEALALEPGQLVDAGVGEVEEFVELRGKRAALAGPLDLDQSAASEADDIDVDVCRRIFGVIEVEDRLAVDDPGTHGGDTILDDRRSGLSPEWRRRASAIATNAAGDRGRSRAAVGIEHIGVHVDRDGPGPRGPPRPGGCGRSAAGSRWRGRRRRAGLRVGVLPGSIAYSAVSQPIPLPSRNGGTVSEICAVARTAVAPRPVQHAAGTVGKKLRSIVTGLS